MALTKSRFKSRKVLRKEARKAKKQRRQDYYERRGKPKVEAPAKTNTKKESSVKDKFRKKDSKFKNLKEEQDYEINKEKNMKKMLDKEIKKKRIERLMEDNLKEEMEIKKLEKQLKFRKGKRSGAFALDGLDFLLDICDKKITRNEGERAFQESDTEFENDLSTITGSKKIKSKKSKKTQKDEEFMDDSDIPSDDTNSNVESDPGGDEDFDATPRKHKKLKTDIDNTFEIDDVDSVHLSTKLLKNDKKRKKKKQVEFLIDEDNVEEMNFDSEDNFDDDLCGLSGDLDSNSEINVESDDEIEAPHQKKARKNEEKDKKNKKIKNINNPQKEKDVNEGEIINKTKKKQNGNKLEKKLVEKVGEGIEQEEVEDVEESAISVENDDNNNESGDEMSEKSSKGQYKNVKESETWEDIYGRTRDKEGNIINTYKPPHLRKVESGNEVSNNKEKLMRLKRQLKGLLNRLAENNMASISSQIEQLYMSHSRNEMNETLKDLFTEAIVTDVLTPERLVAEHAMLVAILHANVGSEIGAHFLQFSVNEFNKLLKDDIPVEDKHINNLLLFIMHLYNFQIFHSKLMYDLIHELLKNLQEKQIELLLMVLRTVGFSLRKDDPMALKAVVLKIQQQTNGLGNNDENYTRMKYMLEVVSAIKNNNVSKIPNYNPELVEHLKKCMKVFIRKGNYNTELNISLQDLLNAEEHGRWWVVGSAWSGSGPSDNTSKANESKDLSPNKISFSEKLLDLAKKQRMNTDVRRTVFCTLMSAEDYLDAFEKLLKLGLKGAVEREIINVLIHCSLQEKVFNPYYFHLANKLCVFDRKYQMMIQYAVWDKIKELNSLLGIQVTNLAQFLGNIIVNRGLPLSVLKVIEFSELDKIAVKFVRQVLLTIFLTDEETVANVFSRIVNSPKLKIFRDGIRLFIHHFLVKNIKKNPDENSDHLSKMIDIADKVLTSSDLRMIF